MPKLTFLLMADEANITSGKLNVLGVFNVINVKSVPSFHPKMVLVAEIGGLNEGPHKVELRFTDTNSQAWVPPVSIEVRSDGLSNAQMICTLQNFPILPFDVAKILTLSLHVGAEELGHMDLHLRKVK